MKYRMIVGAFLAFALSACGGSSPADGESEPITEPVPDPASPPEPSTVTEQRIEWGSENQQFGDLYLPGDNGDPYPVVVMIHGGCWQSGFGLSFQDDLSGALAERGFAVWNIEYRRLGNGGEWPVMFEDVAAATEYLRVLAEAHPLDLSRVAAMGHSAGGHLALWLISRGNIQPNSVLYDPAPFPVRGAVPLGGIGDLEFSMTACDGSRDEIIERRDLDEAAYQQRLENTSPIHMLPTGARSILISGENDGVVPPRESQAYMEQAVQAGDMSEHLVLDGLGHFGLISSTTVDMNLLEDSLLQVMAD